MSRGDFTTAPGGRAAGDGTAPLHVTGFRPSDVDHSPVCGNLDPVQTVVDRLEGVRQTGPRQWQARCPGHEDHVASLSIGRGEDGCALLHCHAGCDLAGVLRALGLTEADLFPVHGESVAGKPAEAAKREPAQKRGKSKTVHPTAEAAAAAAGRLVNGRFVASWPYHDPDGQELLRILRFALPDGSKGYRPIHRNGAGWSIGDPPGRLPLYGLTSLDSAPQVIVCEGEKCVDAARCMGIAATTSAHGAKSARKTDWSPLAGREVIILPDNDRAGREYAKGVADILTHLKPPATVRMVDLPGLPPSGDIVDWLDAQDGPPAEGLREALLQMARNAPVWTSAPDGASGEPAPVLTCLADVRPQPVRWLWRGRIPRGKLTLLVGDPNSGKSLITLDMTARVSGGLPWPDSPGTENPAGGVVLLSAEDDLADTVRPRLDAAGAEARRVVALQRVRRYDARTGSERSAPFLLGEDLPALEQAIRQTAACGLVIIDPITAYLGRVDSHKNAELRGLLAPLAELAARYDAAVVAVTHLRKGEGPAMYRAMGSLAFVAAARAVYVVAPDKLDPAGERRLILPIKNNLARDQTGLAYRIEEPPGGGGVPVVRWDPEPVGLSADEALGEPAVDRSRRAEREEAGQWLREALADGPIPSGQVIRDGKEQGFSEKTLRRAYKDLRGRPRKGGMDDGWYWDPPPEDGQLQGQGELAIFGEAGHLRGRAKAYDASPAVECPEDVEDGQLVRRGHLRSLDPDCPGPTDLLSGEQYIHYQTAYAACRGEPGQKHAVAWRAAVTGGRA